MLCQFSDLILGHADVVQPLHADLAAGAVTHGLLDVIAGLIAEQAVHPDAQLVLGLILELLLTVQRPAEQPVWPLKGSRLQILRIYWGILSSSVVMVALSQLLSSGSEQNFSG